MCTDMRPVECLVALLSEVDYEGDEIETYANTAHSEHQQSLHHILQRRKWVKIQGHNVL